LQGRHHFAFRFRGHSFGLNNLGYCRPSEGQHGEFEALDEIDSRAKVSQWLEENKQLRLELPQRLRFLESLFQFGLSSMFFILSDRRLIAVM
jgi:hypothetical protein